MIRSVDKNLLVDSAETCGTANESQGSRAIEGDGLARGMVEIKGGISIEGDVAVVGAEIIAEGELASIINVESRSGADIEGIDRARSIKNDGGW